MTSAAMLSPRKIFRKIRPAVFSAEAKTISATATREVVRWAGAATPSAASRKPAAP